MREGLTAEQMTALAQEMMATPEKFWIDVSCSLCGADSRSAIHRSPLECSKEMGRKCEYPAEHHEPVGEYTITRK